MIGLVAKIALLTKFVKIIEGENLLPIGKELGVHDWAVHLVTIELDPIRAGRDSNQGLGARLQDAPGTGHGNQIPPWVQGVAIPNGKEKLRKSRWTTYLHGAM